MKLERGWGEIWAELVSKDYPELNIQPKMKMLTNLGDTFYKARKVSVSRRAKAANVDCKPSTIQKLDIIRN